MNAADFVRKWKGIELSERSACQQHFLDLCDLVGHPKPADLDKTGESFTFERGATKEDGGDGWADVWKRGFFGWEYKGPHANLEKAYKQLLQYREALENPPLLVTCDLGRLIVHTNFTGTRSEEFQVKLEALDTPEGLRILRALFFEPDSLKPRKTSAAITEDAARYIGEIAKTLRDRGEEAHLVARFLDRVVFCMFAEDNGLLQAKLFSRLLEKTKQDPPRFQKLVAQLFEAMAEGGDFGADTIRRFNGGLFPKGGAVPLLTQSEIASLLQAALMDWSAVDPSIFGTLFERGLDPNTRAQLGAHYTSREDIETLIEPVVMAPLRREWTEVQKRVLSFLAKRDEKKASGVWRYEEAKRRRFVEDAIRVLRNFLERLATLKVLDPACGSGNFLFVTLQKLKDLEKEVLVWAMNQGLPSFLPQVHPRQLYGIEINPYAYELAQMTVWIGYLQWIRANGFGEPPDPVLETLEDNFQNMDAIMDLAAESRGGPLRPPAEKQDREGTEPLPYDYAPPAAPRESDWPEVDFIVSNPPFLGDKMMRRELGDLYVDALRDLYKGRIPGQSDLCCYWFEKARAHIEAGKCQRAGLLATQGIRGGANREVLKRIKESGDIFFAESDRPWILDGANVHVSMVAFDGGQESARILDRELVSTVNANLTATADIADARVLSENSGLSFIGVSMHGPFDISASTALALLASAGNPKGNLNSKVVRPVLNAKDVVARPEGRWIIAFAPALSQEEACLYQAPFEHVLRVVRPIREENHRAVYRNTWWIHGEPRPAMWKAIAGLPRFIGTPRVSKHRVVTWLGSETVPSDALTIFARSDDYFFGVLNSRFHEVWSRAQGTQLREATSGARYTPTSCFETFPFPWPPGQEPKDDPKVAAIAEAAKELDALRQNWLNPPEWVQEEILEFPGSTDGPWARFIIPLPGHPEASISKGSLAYRHPETSPAKGSPGRISTTVPATPTAEILPGSSAEGAVRMTSGAPPSVGTVRYPRLVPKDADCATKLKKRTLTNLYNERPTWLALAHQKLDQAVAAAYGWPADLAHDQILEKLLALNLERAKLRWRPGMGG